jgi:hypothetical protein
MLRVKIKWHATPCTTFELALRIEEKIVIAFIRSHGTINPSQDERSKQATQVTRQISEYLIDVVTCRRVPVYDLLNTCLSVWYLKGR